MKITPEKGDFITSDGKSEKFCRADHLARLPGFMFFLPLMIM
jgi:hypothetical protein